MILTANIVIVNVLIQQKIRQTIKKSLEILAPKLLLKYWNEKNYEPELALIPYLCNKEKISIDVGAHMGIYTHRMIKHSKECWAFEPIPKLSKFLRRTFSSNVIVNSTALSDKNGHAELRIPENSLAESTIDVEKPMNRFDKIKIITVPVKKLDDFKLKDVEFIKIDAEGHEEQILHGAKNLLENDKPSLIIEIEERHKKNSILTIRKFLEELGYKGFFLLDNKLHNIIEFDPKLHQNEEQLTSKTQTPYIHNFVFIISEKLNCLGKYFS